METKVLKDLRMADSMREFLRNIAYQSSVAEYLLNTHCFTDYGDFLAIRKKDDVPMISFCPKGKTQEFTEDGNYKRDGRQEGSPARVAQKLIGPDVFTNAEYELFSNLFTGKLANNIEFHVGKTAQDFQFAYLEDNYVPEETGSLWHSCMRYSSCQNYVSLYARLGAQILYATINGKVAARAILWNLEDDGLMLDRVYGHNDSIKYSMLQYAKKKLGISYYKERDSYDTPMDFIQVTDEGEEAVTRSFCIYVGSVIDYDTYVPYMDTFKYFSDGYLYNDKEPDMDLNIDSRFEMCSTDGNYSIKYRCKKCGDWMDEDDVCWVGNNAYCGDCAVHDDWSEEYILREDAVQANDGQGYLITTHINNTVVLGDGSYAIADKTVYDDYDDEYIFRNESKDYNSIVDGQRRYFTTHTDNTDDRDLFAHIFNECYEIETCEGVIIENIDGDWYLIDSSEWKEAKENQRAEIENNNNEEVA